MIPVCPEPEPENFGTLVREPGLGFLRETPEPRGNQWSDIRTIQRQGPYGSRFSRMNPEYFVITTGQSHSVREFLDTAFTHAGLDYRDHLITDEKLYRPSETHILQGDASKAHKKLDRHLTITFEELVREMAESDHRRKLLSPLGNPHSRAMRQKPAKNSTGIPPSPLKK